MIIRIPAISPNHQSSFTSRVGERLDEPERSDQEEEKPEDVGDRGEGVLRADERDLRRLAANRTPRCSTATSSALATDPIAKSGPAAPQNMIPMITPYRRHRSLVELQDHQRGDDPSDTDNEPKPPEPRDVAHRLARCRADRVFDTFPFPAVGITNGMPRLGHRPGAARTGVAALDRPLWRLDRRPPRAGDRRARQHRERVEERRGRATHARQSAPHGLLAHRHGRLALPRRSGTDRHARFLAGSSADHADLVRSHGAAPSRIARLPLGAAAPRPAGSAAGAP